MTAKNKETARPARNKQTAATFEWPGGVLDKDPAQGLKMDVIRHIVSSLGSDYERKSPYSYYMGLALAVRDRLIDRWLRTQRSYYDRSAKRVYYLSLEYLPGKSLINNLHCLGLFDTAQEVMSGYGFDMEDLADVEWDAGLGNGGLGRLASCYMDSMATLNVPGYGYGIRYDYGIFRQVIENGRQVEKSDNWMRVGNPWQFERGQHLYPIKFYGSINEYTDVAGNLRHEWVNTDHVLAMACDMLVPGFNNGNVINMRLWAAKSDLEFNLEFFNTGNYVGAVKEKIKDENISKVLYPSEEAMQGRELRLKQQYFFVAATLQDIMRRFKKVNTSFDDLPDKVAIQLNDTHPSIAIPELMRLLVDVERLPWDKAWDLSTRTFAYTNHTILPEALETWPCNLLQRVLPRHMQIIYEINRRFLEQIELNSPDRETADKKKQQLSLIQEFPSKRVRMAHLSIVGSHSVNGVSALHTDILKERVFEDFHAMYPGKINNKTNGVTPRRWLLQCNPGLAGLLKEQLGLDWVRDLKLLSTLEHLADDESFRTRWRDMRMANKTRLANYIRRKLGEEVDLNSLFDVHIKRIHEYKRQLMNVLHVITLYNRLRKSPSLDFVPRTVIFAGKAAPGYYMAKLIIRLINGVAHVVNNDPAARDRLKVLFLPNYCVSQAERIIPATDLSEQISMAGMEASGTGNMKFAINGALTIGTLDGANVEMGEEIGLENMFIFGHTEEEIANLRTRGYNPRAFLDQDNELQEALDLIQRDHFCTEEHGLFTPITDDLLHGGDRYFVLADYRAYVDAQARVSELFRDREEWTRRSILNSLRMGKFSSDRSIAEYARDIWNVSCDMPGKDFERD